MNRDILHLTKLNVGCGNDIRPDCVNLDSADLPGVDAVTDLTVFPWQFTDNRFDEIVMINVLEHLPDTIATMEELWRISRSGCKLMIRVPYWNSLHWASDPTHVKRFSQFSMNFFDPTTKQGIERPYYSTARFRIQNVHYWLPLAPARERYWVKISHVLPKRILSFFARYLSNIIWVLEFELVALKPASNLPS
jgi:SAM-dependent methyltransferase